MIRWFQRGARPEPQRDHPLAKSGKVRELIAKLPVNDSLQAIGEIASWIELLNNADGFTIDSRFRDLDLLDAASRQPARMLFAEYLATPRQKKTHEHRLWTSTFNFWRLLGEGYQKCLQEAESEPESKSTARGSMAVYAGRTLRCLRQQLRWNLMRYEVPEPRVWATITQVFQLAERGGWLDESIAVYSESLNTSTVKQEFAKGMMLAASSTHSLQPAGQDLAVRIVSYFSGLFVVSREPQGCTHWIDLAAPKAPVRILRKPPQDSTVRYFGAGPALGELDQLLAHITYTRGLPEGLNLGPRVDQDVLLGLLKHLGLDWAGKTQARCHERQTAAARITVVPGLTDIVRALEFANNDSLDFTHQQSAESWIVQDISAGGYGAVIPSIAGDWVEVGSLIGVQGESFRDWRICLIRRVTRNEQQQQHVGVQVLNPAAMLVSLRPAETPVTTKAARGVLLSSKLDSAKEVEILTPRGLCAARNSVEATLGEAKHTLLPLELVEHNGDYDRMRFKVVG